MRYSAEPDKLIYNIRPEVTDRNDNKAADTKPTEAISIAATDPGLKKWILPSANSFIKDPAKHYQRPKGNPGRDFPFVQNDFNDKNWEQVILPHDWAIKQSFYDGGHAEVGGGMGRLPSQGVEWYRKKLNIPSEDRDKFIYLDIDGAMSYAMVWLNGNLVGGWPYGVQHAVAVQKLGRHNHFRLDPVGIGGGDLQPQHQRKGRLVGGDGGAFVFGHGVSFRNRAASRWVSMA